MILADCFGPKERALVARAGPKMSVSNVAEYYFGHDKEFWTMQDFKLPVPPFTSMWVEYRFPRLVRSKDMGETSVRSYERGLVPYFGCFVGNVDYEQSTGQAKIFEKGSNYDKVDGYLRGKPDLNGWMLRGSMYYVGREDRVELVGENIDMAFKLADDGSMSEFSFPSEMGKDSEERASKAYFLHPILLAFSFRNCKNIEVVDVEAPRKLQAARIRRGKEPLIRYSVVNVLPLANLKASTNRSVVSADGQGVALHIRAGNFAHYGDKFGRKKLFGKYEGMYWRPQATVGSLDRGLSVHDYSVKKVEE